MSATTAVKVAILVCLALSLDGTAAAQRRVARPADWQRKVTKNRLDRNNEFHDAKESPLLPKQIARFGGLSYFPIDAKYRVRARFVPDPSGREVIMPTSSGKTKVFTRYGELRFKLDGREHALGAYRSEAVSQMKGYEKYLLVPFTDLTSGEETYGGGRYIDYEEPAAEWVMLDFNMAYNPSCAYGGKAFSCPVPPAENRLDLRVDAGEKAYH